MRRVNRSLNEMHCYTCLNACVHVYASVCCICLCVSTFVWLRVCNCICVHACEHLVYILWVHVCACLWVQVCVSWCWTHSLGIYCNMRMLRSISLGPLTLTSKNKDLRWLSKVVLLSRRGAGPQAMLQNFPVWVLSSSSVVPGSCTLEHILDLINIFIWFLLISPWAWYTFVGYVLFI